MKYKSPLWVLSHPLPRIIPSYVVSAIIPSSLLQIPMTLFLKNSDPIKTIKKYSPDVIMVSKMFHNDVINLIKEAKRNNIKIISIFDDWFVDKNIINKRHLINLEAEKLSNVNVVKTSEAAKVLKNNLAINSQIIPDYLRFDKAIIGDLHFNDPIKVSWFGMPTNFDTLLFGINQIVESNIACELSIISSQFRFLQKNLTTIDKTKINFKLIEWTEAMDKEVIKSDVVIIPLLDDSRRKIKSSNRIIDAINLGKFVVMSDVHQFKEFKEFCYMGHIGEGLKWVQNNRQSAKEMVLKGQNYVDKQYSKEKITKLWRDIIYN